MSTLVFNGARIFPQGALGYRLVLSDRLRYIELQPLPCYRNSHDCVTIIAAKDNAWPGEFPGSQRTSTGLDNSIRIHTTRIKRSKTRIPGPRVRWHGAQAVIVARCRVPSATNNSSDRVFPWMLFVIGAWSPMTALVILLLGAIPIFSIFIQKVVYQWQFETMLVDRPSLNCVSTLNVVLFLGAI